MSKGVEDFFAIHASAKPMPPDARQLLRFRLHKALQSGKECCFEETKSVLFRSTAEKNKTRLTINVTSYPSNTNQITLAKRKLDQLVQKQSW